MQCRIQRQCELVVPPELEAGLGQFIVAFLRSRVSLAQIGGVGGDLIGDHAGFHIVAIR